MSDKVDGSRQHTDPFVSVYCRGTYLKEHPEIYALLRRFPIECPTSSDLHLNLYQVAEEIARRLHHIFLRDDTSRRPVYGDTRKFQEDPHCHDYLLFYEYFHGDNDAGLGAGHQTGWTGLIARALHLFATTNAEQVLELGKIAGVTEVEVEAQRA